MEPIDNKTLNSWRLKAFNISREEIALRTDLSKTTLRSALKYGLATPETKEKLNEFFKNLQPA